VERAAVNHESTLVILGIELRETAHEIEHRVIRDEGGIAPEKADSKQSQLHRILLFVTADPKAAMLVRRARRVSDFLGAECFAVTVQLSGDLGSLPGKDREAIKKHLNFARNMRIETRILQGDDVAQPGEFARRNKITRYSAFNRQPSLLWRAGRNCRLARDMQVVNVSEREPE
jgi:K+-sensing histidine kinase KdpD